MFLTLLALLGLSAMPQNPVLSAYENFQNLTSYSATLQAGEGKNTEIIRYFYKKPGYIRMEFVTPHQGALLVYNPLTRLVRLKPFGFAKAITLSLSPDSFLLKSAAGHQIDASDVGALLRRVLALQAQGETRLLEESGEAKAQTLLVEVRGNPGISLDQVVRYRLRLALGTWFPLEVAAFGANGALREEVRLDDLKLNPELADEFFVF